MVKRVLMIAYHYPPVRGSSGVQRTLQFSRHLLDYAWEPSILTVHPRAYPNVGNDQLSDIPRAIEIKRAFALDTARHLSWRGAYPRCLSWPDRWISWWLGAIPAGLNMIKRLRPRLIWSTYPIATAHLIGYTLHRLTGLPWVADFRDPMTEGDYPPDPIVRRLWTRIEKLTVNHAERIVFATPGSLRLYAQRYPHIPKQSWICIPNGYDEDTFRVAEAKGSLAAANRQRVELLHSGLVYLSERDPSAFFAALAELQNSAAISAARLRITLRAAGSQTQLKAMIEQYGLQEMVVLAPALDHVDALREMLSADGLLIFQASNCNNQIPAKLYEYLRARRPIFGMTDLHGDTAQLLKECGIDTLAHLHSKEDIKRGLLAFLNAIEHKQAPIASDNTIARYARAAQAHDLARLFEELLDERHGLPA